LITLLSITIAGSLAYLRKSRSTAPVHAVAKWGSI
jgi:hypothetical protein